MELFYSQEQYDEEMADRFGPHTTYEHEVYLEECRRMYAYEREIGEYEARLYDAVRNNWDAVLQIVAYLTGDAPAQPDFRHLKNDVAWQIERQDWVDNGEIPF